MDPNSLLLLVEILDAGSLSEAARRLKMTRANVGYHLQQLERSAGLQLVRRTTRRLDPTEIGLRLYQHGVGIRNQLLAAKESVSTLGQALQGRIRLSVPSGYGQFIMAPWLIDFKRQYPGIVLDVLFENRVDDLLRDEVDIAIRVMSEPPPMLVARDLGPVRYVACAASDYASEQPLPMRLQELGNAALITSGVIGRHLRVSGTLDGQRQEVILEPGFISENFGFLRQAIRAGLGIGLVPDYVVQEDIRNGEVVTCLDDWQLSIFGSRMFMLYMPDRHHTRATSTFIEFILEHCREGRQSTASTAMVAT